MNGDCQQWREGVPCHRTRHSSLGLVLGLSALTACGHGKPGDAERKLTDTASAVDDSAAAAVDSGEDDTFVPTHWLVVATLAVDDQGELTTFLSGNEELESYFEIVLYDDGWNGSTHDDDHLCEDYFSLTGASEDTEFFSSELGQWKGWTADANSFMFESDNCARLDPHVLSGSVSYWAHASNWGWGIGSVADAGSAFQEKMASAVRGRAATNASAAAYVYSDAYIDETAALSLDGCLTYAIDSDGEATTDLVDISSVDGLPVGVLFQCIALFTMDIP